MKIKSILTCLLISFFCNGQNNTNSKNLIIDLEHKSFDDDFVVDSDCYYTTIKLYSFGSKPKYENYLKESYKGIPQNDSISFYGNFDYAFLLTEYVKHGDVTKQEALDIIKRNDIDTLNYTKVKFKPYLILAIGFYKNKQFIVADANRNEDFSDDIKYEYDINFRNDPYKDIDYLNKLPITEFVYEDINKEDIALYNRRFILYPDRNNQWSISSRTNPNKEKESFSILKFRDYWEGETTVNSEKIKFSFHGYSNNYGISHVRPSNVKYVRFSPTFDQRYQFKYYGKNNSYNDTIRIGENRYLIDSISRSISKVYLRYIPNAKKFGYAIGENIDTSIKFHDLNGKTFLLSEFLNKNKYTLLDFWGTWCGPCVALTPKLIKMNNEYGGKLNILSVAVDANTSVVKKYILKKKITWKTAFINQDRCWENRLIKKLRVEGYPSLILVDSSGKIVLRGSGDSLEEIERIIKGQ